MRIVYCWRCGIEVPMFDESEYRVIYDHWVRAVRIVKEQARFQPVADRRVFIMARYRPLFDAYTQITGKDEVFEPSSILHHRIAVLGPPCSDCGKPLRTPRAKYCAACGASSA